MLVRKKVNTFCTISTVIISLFYAQQPTKQAPISNTNMTSGDHKSVDTSMSIIKEFFFSDYPILQTSRARNMQSATFLWQFGFVKGK